MFMKLSRLRWLLVCPLLVTMLANAQETTSPQGAGSDVSVPSGPPLQEGEVIILLQAKVPLDIIQKFVSGRGVNFVSTKETSKRVLAAGGNVALVGTINLNQKDDPMASDLQQDKDKKKK
jgi:hypothetical protein